MPSNLAERSGLSVVQYWINYDADWVKCLSLQSSFSYSSITNTSLPTLAKRRTKVLFILCLDATRRCTGHCFCTSRSQNRKCSHVWQFLEVHSIPREECQSWSNAGVAGPCRGMARFVFLLDVFFVFKMYLTEYSLQIIACGYTHSFSKHLLYW